MKKVFFTIAGIISVLIFTGCYEPSPIYGTWADNNGSKIIFMADGSFSATVENTEGDDISYEGSYSVVDNVIVFKYSADEKSYSMNTEWDIRGSMLYLDWITKDTTKHLTLYHISK